MILIGSSWWGFQVCFLSLAHPLVCTPALEVLGLQKINGRLEKEEGHISIRLLSEKLCKIKTWVFTPATSFNLHSRHIPYFGQRSQVFTLIKVIFTVNSLFVYSDYFLLNIWWQLTLSLNCKFWCNHHTHSNPNLVAFSLFLWAYHWEHVLHVIWHFLIYQMPSWSQVRHQRGSWWLGAALPDRVASILQPSVSHHKALPLSHQVASSTDFLSILIVLNIVWLIFVLGLSTRC